MTTKSDRLLKDLTCVPSPVFYIFAAVALFCAFFVHGFGVVGIFTAIFLVLLTACACADINAGIVPDLLVITIAVLGIVEFLVLEGFSVPGLLSRLIGLGCISIPMLIVTLIVKGAFGGGDIKLVAAAGLFLAWKYTLIGTFIGVFISGFYAMYLIIIKKAGKQSKIKLAPFLAYGLAVASLFGEEISLIL